MKNILKNTKKDKISGKNTGLDEKRTEFFQKFNKMLDEYGFKVSVSMNFPDYKQPPEDLALALQIIAKHKHNMVINLEDK